MSTPTDYLILNPATGQIRKAAGFFLMSRMMNDLVPAIFAELDTHSQTNSVVFLDEKDIVIDALTLAIVHNPRHASESELTRLRTRLAEAERLLRPFAKCAGVNYYFLLNSLSLNDYNAAASFLAESPSAEPWSKEPPKGGGWYWWIPEPEEAFQAIEVSDGKVCVDDELVPVTEAGGEWQGPIRPV